MPPSTAITAWLLDTNSASNNTDIENNVSSVVPTKGALVRASFDTRIGVRALLNRDPKATSLCRLVPWS